MEITVDRTCEEDVIVFTIKVKDLKKSPFNEASLQMMKTLDIAKSDVYKHENPYLEAVVMHIHAAKEAVCDKVIKNLKFEIKEQFEPKFKQVCQEIYNSVVDSQEEFVKSWMLESEPERFKYYFNNDKTIESDYEV